MAEIVPAINVESFEEVVRRIRIAELHMRWVHIDVADGSFTPRAVWHNAEELKNFQTPLFIEIHFMVDEPEEKIAPWLLTPAKKIIFHIESARDVDRVIDDIHGARKEAALAVRPDTSWEALVPYAGRVDMLQTLAVPPGPSGQEFDPRTIEKIKNLRARFPKTPIEVDGGVRVGVARACADAGADFIVVGSSLFSPESKFQEKLKALRDDIALVHS